MTRRLKIIAEQHPDWLVKLGIGLIVLAIVAIGLWADNYPVVALLTALPPLCLGSAALGRADAITRRRAERAANTAQIEREMGI